MKDKISNRSISKTNCHLWGIGTLFIFIYFIGSYDFVMIQVHNIGYLNSLDIKGDVMGYFTNYPLILKILWAINIISGLLAGIFLLLRKKTAILFALSSAISKLILDIFTFSFMKRWEIFGAKASCTDLSILLITFGFLIYCVRVRNKGIYKD